MSSSPSARRRHADNPQPWRPGLAESLTTDFVSKYKQLQAELDELRDAKEQADKYQKLYEESQAEMKELLGEM